MERGQIASAHAVRVETHLGLQGSDPRKVEERAPVEQGAGRSSATLRVADERALKRLAARRGGAMVIEEPEAARVAAVEWAEAGLAQYS